MTEPSFRKLADHLGQGEKGKGSLSGLYSVGTWFCPSHSLHESNSSSLSSPCHRLSTFTLPGSFLPLFFQVFPGKEPLTFALLTFIPLANRSFLILGHCTETTFFLPPLFLPVPPPSAFQNTHPNQRSPFTASIVRSDYERRAIEKRFLFPRFILSWNLLRFFISS